MGPNNLCCVTRHFLFCPYVPMSVYVTVYKYKILASLSTVFIKGHIELPQVLKCPCRTSFFTHVGPYNAQGLRNKFGLFSSYISDNRPDIVCVSETWLDDEVMDAEVECPGYRVFRRCRNLKDYPEGMFSQSTRGGVLILVKSDLNPTQANLLDFGTEIIWVYINSFTASAVLLLKPWLPLWA